MRLSPPSAGRAGLTLLEVLVALAIFMMSLAALTHLVTLSSNMAVEASQRSRAAQLARSKMAEFACGAQALSASGETPFDDDPDYSWSAQVDQGAAVGLYNITVCVTYHPDDPYPVKVEMSRVLLDPQYVGSTQDVPASPTGSSADSSSDPSSDSSSSSSASGGAAAASPAASGSGAKSASSGSSGSKAGGSGSAPSTGAGMGTGSGKGSTGGIGTGGGTGTGTGSGKGSTGSGGKGK